MARSVWFWLATALALATLAGCAANPAPASTPTQAATASATLVTTATAEPTSTPGETATSTPSPSASPLPTETATVLATAEPSATATAVASPRPTQTPTPRPPTATAAPTRTPQPPTATATPRPQARRVFMGYYVPYDPSSWTTLAAQADALDYVALQVATLDYCGNVASKDDRTLLAFARARGLPVLASVFTSSGPLNHSVLTNPDSTANAVQQLVDYVVEVGYAGLDVDLEGVPADDRAALTSFVARLSAALRERGKLITMAVPAKTRDVTTGWAGAYDYAALAPHLDLAVIMSYSYTTSSSAPGSTAPYDWVERVAAYAAGQFTPRKTLLGLAFYGYDWNTTLGGRATALRYPQAAALAAAYGASIRLDPTTRSATFAYTAKAGDPLPYQQSLPPLNHEIVERKAPACPLTPPPPPTPVPRTPTPTPVPPPMQDHIVWLENAASVAERLGIAERYGLRGAVAWRLGQEDPAVWPLIEDWKQ